MRALAIFGVIVTSLFLLTHAEQKATPAPEPDRTQELILEGTLSAVSTELQEFQSTIVTLQAQLNDLRDSHARLSAENARLVAKLAEPKVAAQPIFNRSTFRYAPYLPERNATGNFSNGSCRPGLFGRRR